MCVLDIPICRQSRTFECIQTCFAPFWCRGKRPFTGRIIWGRSLSWFKTFRESPPTRNCKQLTGTEKPLKGIPCRSQHYGIVKSSTVFSETCKIVNALFSNSQWDRSWRPQMCCEGCLPTPPSVESHILHHSPPHFRGTSSHPPQTDSTNTRSPQSLWLEVPQSNNSSMSSLFHSSSLASL